MAFDPQKRTRALEELRRKQIVDEAALSPTERLQQAEELLALAWSLHGPPREEPWALLAARKVKPRR